MLPRSLIGPIVLGFLALNLLGQALPLYTDYLWFQEVKFASVFTTMLWYKIALGVAGGLIFALVVYLNVRLAARPRAGDVLTELEDPLGLPSRLVIEPLFRRFLLPGALILGILAGMQAAGQWETVLRFLNGQPFNVPDPLFGRDISFYVFRLPLLETLYSWSLRHAGDCLPLGDGHLRAPSRHPDHPAGSRGSSVRAHTPAHPRRAPADRQGRRLLPRHLPPAPVPDGYRVRRRIQRHQREPPRPARPGGAGPRAAPRSASGSSAGGESGRCSSPWGSCWRPTSWGWGCCPTPCSVFAWSPTRWLPNGRTSSRTSSTPGWRTGWTGSRKRSSLPKRR